MAKQIHWIAVDGEVHTEQTEVPPSLDVMQAYVEGYIEVVNVLFNSKPQQMIVNEEGLIKKMMINWKATSIYHANSLVNQGKIPDTPIAGPAILLEDVRLD